MFACLIQKKLLIVVQDFSAVMLTDSLLDELPDLLYEGWATNISFLGPHGMLPD